MDRLSATAALALALLTGASAAGPEGNAPLAESQKELRKLQAEGGAAATSTTGATDGLKASLPTFQAPADNAPALQRLSPEQLQRETKQRSDAQKNWLLNGMKKLSRESDAPERGTDEQEDAMQLDTSDPGYLIKLYEKQKKAAQTKAMTETKGAHSTTKSDPFAPFLQGWLATSPVKDQLLADPQRTLAGGLNVASAVLSGEPTNTAPVASTGGPGHDATALGTKPNPYLLDLGAPPDSASPGGHSSVPTTSGLAPAVPPGTPSSPSVVPTLQSAPEPARADRRPPPPPLAEEKKYFPQLNKF